MKVFRDFKSFNSYLGLPDPADTNIDIGYYSPETMRLQSEPVSVDFYRISIKINFRDKTNPNSQPVKTVSFLFDDRNPFFDILYLCGKSRIPI